MLTEFMDRADELGRLQRALDRTTSSLVVVYGRRRLGKSRLVREALVDRQAISYFGDERDAHLQRESVAAEIAAVIPGFAEVTYRDWDTLLARYWREAPPGCVLALDEFPDLVIKSPELPSLLQKRLEPPARPARHVVLTGSSQAMMQGLVLDATAPLYGRAVEILELKPLAVGWLGRALRLRRGADTVAHWAAWGGVPRYWELAMDCADLSEALTTHVLDPLGVLHREPERLLLDDMMEITRASSLLALVGRGVRRVSEMGGRLAVPATSLSRPLARLTDLGLLVREIPFGRSARDTKQTNYRIADPFLRTWYRFVDPNRSRLGARLIEPVARAVASDWPAHVAEAWEDLARASTAWLHISGAEWDPGARWWGRGVDGNDMEIDVLAFDSNDPDHVLAGEARARIGAREADRVLHELRGKVARCPATLGKRITLTLWSLSGTATGVAGATVVGANDVVSASIAGQEAPPKRRRSR